MGTYKELVQFWTKIHQPSQSYNIKRQYRSVVWYFSNKQKQVAEKIVKAWKEEFELELYTSVEPASSFYVGKEYHQHYQSKHCKTNRASDSKITKLQRRKTDETL